MARNALISESCLVEVIVIQSMAAKGSVDGESTISSTRSILRIDPGRTVTGPPFSDAAMPAIIPNRKIQKNSERNEPTKKASTPAKNVLKKFIPIYI